MNRLQEEATLVKTMKRDDPVEHRATGRVGSYAHQEADGKHWVVWPPDSTSHRYSAGGYFGEDLRFGSEGQIREYESALRNVADIVEDLTSAMDGLSDAQKAQALLDLGFSARQQDVIKMLLIEAAGPSQLTLI